MRKGQHVEHEAKVQEREDLEHDSERGAEGEEP